MAHVTLTDGRELDVADSDTGLLDYYRGIGATVEGVVEADPFPHVFVNGERVYPPEVAEPDEYDPADHHVDEVNAYLETADEPARERVFALERDGKARVGILDGPHAVFDPTAHNVDEVNAYLAGVDDAERDRVVDAELAGEARKGIVGDGPVVGD